MNPESLSIPIAPTTACCSENAAQPDVQPTELQSGHTCQSETPSAAQAGSCSTSPPAPAGESSTSDSSTDESWTEPDDAALIDALRTVVDPELMINIVDLGLVYSINHTDRKVVVEMTLTSPACPAGPQIISQAKMSLEKLKGVDTAEIKLTMSPPWTPDRMTDDARDQLGIF